MITGELNREQSMTWPFGRPTLLTAACQLLYKGDAGTFFAKVGFPLCRPPLESSMLRTTQIPAILVSLVLHQNDFEVVTVANPSEAIQLAQARTLASTYWITGWKGCLASSYARAFENSILQRRFFSFRGRI